MCPSANPEMEGARIIGVVGGTAEEPELSYLARGVEVGPDTLAQLGDVEPTLVFRFAAPCAQHRCAHFEGNQCSLAQRIVKMVPETVELLPRCQIRSTCRWFAEQGGAACRRCPQVVTSIEKRDGALNRAAAPPGV